MTNIRERYKQNRGKSHHYHHHNHQNDDSSTISGVSVEDRRVIPVEFAPGFDNDDDSDVWSDLRMNMSRGSNSLRKNMIMKMKKDGHSDRVLRSVIIPTEQNAGSGWGDLGAIHHKRSSSTSEVLPTYQDIPLSNQWEHMFVSENNNNERKMSGDNSTGTHDDGEDLFYEIPNVSPIRDTKKKKSGHRRSSKGSPRSGKRSPRSPKKHRKHHNQFGDNLSDDGSSLYSANQDTESLCSRGSQSPQKNSWGDLASTVSEDEFVDADTWSERSDQWGSVLNVKQNQALSKLDGLLNTSDQVSHDSWEGLLCPDLVTAEPKSVQVLEARSSITELLGSDIVIDGDEAEESNDMDPSLSFGSDSSASVAELLGRNIVVHDDDDNDNDEQTESLDPTASPVSGVETGPSSPMSNNDTSKSDNTGSAIVEALKGGSGFVDFDDLQNAIKRSKDSPQKLCHSPSNNPSKQPPDSPQSPIDETLFSTAKTDGDDDDQFYEIQHVDSDDIEDQPKNDIDNMAVDDDIPDMAANNAEEKENINDSFNAADEPTTVPNEDNECKEDIEEEGETAGGCFAKKSKAQKARLSVSFADDAGLAIEEVFVLGDSDDYQALGNLVILLLNPIERKFEFIHAEYTIAQKTTIRNILQQLPSMAANKAFENKQFTALCRTRNGGNELINSMPISECGIEKQETLVAVMEGFTTKDTVQWALPLLKNERITKAVKQAKRTGRALKYIRSTEEMQSDASQEKVVDGAQTEEDTDTNSDSSSDSTYEEEKGPSFPNEPHKIGLLLHAGLVATVGMFFYSQGN